MTGYLSDATIAVDALSIWYAIDFEAQIYLEFLQSFLQTYNIVIGYNFCSMTINGWELMIPLAFFAGTGYSFFYLYLFWLLLNISITINWTIRQVFFIFYITMSMIHFKWASPYKP